MDQGLAGLATGLAQGIQGYIGMQQTQQNELQKQQQASDLSLNKDQALELYKQTIAGKVDSKTAYALAPEYGKAVDQFTQQNKRPPTIDEFSTMASTIDSGKDQDKANAKAQQTLTKYQDMFNKASTKEKDAQDSTYTAMQQIADAGKNPVAASSVPITLARMMTGTSRINTVEIQKLGGTQAILGRLNQIAQTMATGNLTPQNQQFMTQLAQVLHDSHQTNVEQTGIDHAKQYMKVSGKDLPTAYSDLTGKDYPRNRHQKTGELLPQVPTDTVTGWKVVR